MAAQTLVERKGSWKLEMRGSTLPFVLAFCAMLGASSFVALGARAQDSPPLQGPAPSSTDSTPAADPIPTMFPHPETDRWWISGQANFISQWHPEFRSPYQGPRSLPPQAQDATSRVLTLFTGVRLTNTMELLCDVQETGGHGIGEAVGLGGVTNLDIVRNPDLSKALYIARLMWHQIIPLGHRKIENSRSPLSLFSSLPERRLEIRFGKYSMADFFDTNTYGTDTSFQFMNWTVDKQRRVRLRGGHTRFHICGDDRISRSAMGRAIRRGVDAENCQWNPSRRGPEPCALRKLRV